MFYAPARWVAFELGLLRQRKNAIETLQSKRQQSSLLLILEGNKTAIYYLALVEGKHLIFRYLHGIVRTCRNKG